MTSDKKIALDLYISYCLFKKDCNSLFEKKISYYDICFNTFSFLSRLLKSGKVPNELNVKVNINYFNLHYQKIGQSRIDGFNQGVKFRDIDSIIPERTREEINKVLKMVLSDLKFIDLLSISINSFSEFFCLNLIDTDIVDFNINMSEKKFNFTVDYPKLYIDEFLLCEFKSVSFTFKNWAFLDSYLVNYNSKMEYDFFKIKTIDVYEINSEKQSIVFAGQNEAGLGGRNSFIAPEIECVIEPSSFIRE